MTDFQSNQCTKRKQCRDSKTLPAWYYSWTLSSQTEHE
jgi:hypothetical protein